MELEKKNEFGVSHSDEFTSVEETDSIHCYILGAGSEIGRSCILFVYKGDAVVIDVGSKFARAVYRNHNKEHLFTTQYYFPDFSILTKFKYQIKAIFLTHSHTDHTGGLILLLQKYLEGCDFLIYGGNYTIEALRYELSFKPEKDMSKAEKESLIKKFRRIKDNFIISINSESNFFVRALENTHSTPDSFMYLIQANETRILNTGDWKFDFGSFNRFNWNNITRYCKGVNAVFADSTRPTENGFSISEGDVLEELEKIIKSHPDKRIILTTFASNARRVASLVNLAHKYKRNVFSAGYSFGCCLSISSKLGLFNTKISVSDITRQKTIPDNNSIIFATGPQGDGFMQKYSYGKVKGILPNKNDIVIFSSDIIPGNEFPVACMLKSLISNGVNVYHRVLDKEKYRNIHTTGHGYRAEIMMFLTMICPDIFVGVHGDYIQEYVNTNLAKKVGIKKTVISENGMLISINKNKVKLKRFDYKDIILDNYLQPIDSDIISKRSILNAKGMLIFIFLDNKLLIAKNLYASSLFKYEELMKLNIDLKRVSGSLELEQKISQFLCEKFNIKNLELPIIETEVL